MLPGVSGTLLSPTFLDRHVSSALVARPNVARELRALHQWWQRVERSLGPASSVRALADVAALPLFESLDYRISHLEPHSGGLVGMMTRDASGARVALRVARWGSDADAQWRDTVRAGRSGGARWACVYTGPALRLVDAERSWSRRAVVFDLARTLADERSARALVAVLDAVGAAHGQGSMEALVTQSERHGVAVRESLSEGVLDALMALCAELDQASGQRDNADDATFEQAVTVVYRLLFLLFAEARAMVPVWHEVYRNAYTIEALCHRTLTQPARRGAWKTLQAISRLAQHGCRAGDLVVTPFNGRLFSPRHTPLAERARIADSVVGKVVVSLATTPGVGARERIAYGDLGVEQLGAVYERILEYEPRRERQGFRLTRTSQDRKSTGSFYTPRSITDFLVRRALHPLIAGKSADAILRLRVLDPAMGSGAFLVAACRYLSNAVEHALVDEGQLRSERTRDERAAIRRMVTQRCLFGVDRNAMAVQLARLSLWLASLSSDRPLTFLDHHLATGDSLIGAMLSDLLRHPLTRSARPARTGNSLPLFEFEYGEAMSATILPERFRLAVDPDETPAAVHAKERALAQLTAVGSPLARWKQAADLWCAAWFWPHGRPTSGVYADLLASLAGGHVALRAKQRELLFAQGAAIAGSHGFFHWDLQFPEVFFTSGGQRDPHGGFDLVIGNPPWDVLRADTGDGAARKAARVDHRAQLRFFRDSGVYRCQGTGHANRYQLFLERALQLTRPGGRLAMILPAGLVTDQGSAALRRELLDGTDIDRLIGFDNRNGVFPIHRDVRFVLLTATKGGRTDRLACVFGQRDAEWLDRLPDASSEDSAPARGLGISRSALQHWDPEHLTLPWLTHAVDLQILSTVNANVPPLGDRQGWDVHFGRELNATDDRPQFVRRPSTHDTTLLPVVEGKYLESFRVLVEKTEFAIPRARAAAIVDPTRTFARSRLAYRDVASATNRLTLIAARLAPHTISTHTLFCSKDTLGAEAQYCLLALLNSLVANYLVRLRVTTHVTTAVMSRLPVPRPASKSADFHELATLARRLERTGIAGDETAYAKLNAISARLYGLTQTEYERVLTTFPLLPPHLLALSAAAYRQATEAP